MPEPSPRPYRLLVLSAPSEGELDQRSAALAAHLAAHPELDLGDVAYTLQVGRPASPCRRMLVCRRSEEAIAALRGGGGAARVWNGLAGEPPPVSFVFAGVGDHYAQMARGLYAAEPVFRREIDRCAERLAPELELDLRQVLYPEPAEPGPPTASATERGGRPSLLQMLGRTAAEPAVGAGPLDRTRLLHPAVFAVEHALARLWISWGIAPRSLAGYSVGEYVAACLAGVFTLDAALHLVAFRARLVDALPTGAMLSVFLPAAEVVPLLGGELSLAAINGPTLSVVAGSPRAVAALAERLRERRVPSRRLAAGHPFHSAGLAPAVPALLGEIAALELAPPAIPLVSSVTGTWLTPAEATDPRYWALHMCRTVRFAAALATLSAGVPPALVEIGPGNTLSSMALQPGMTSPPRLAVPSLPHAHDAEPDLSVVFMALGKLWLAGVEPDWQAFHRGERRRTVALP